jgi:hypothetical protein
MWVDIHGLPSFHPCPLCGGSGRDWFFLCSYYRGAGMMEKEEMVGVRIPERIRDGAILEAYRKLWIPNLHVRIGF